jgi:hypothetical protein
MLTVISDEAAIAELAIWRDKNNSLVRVYSILEVSSGLILVIHRYASNLPVRVGNEMYASYQDAMGAYGKLLDQLKVSQ